MRSSSQRPGLTAHLLVASVVLVLVGTLLTASKATAQDGGGARPVGASGAEPAITGQVNLRGTVGIPRGSLRSNIEGLGGGLHGYVGSWTGPASPLLVGLDLGIINYGRSVEDVPFSSTVGPRVPVEVTTKNNIVEAHLSLRLQPRQGRVRPFIEGLAGFKYLFTRTSVEDAGFGSESLEDDRDIADRTNYDDFALSGGAGAGLDIQVYKRDAAGSSVRRVSLHLGVQYLLGQEAEYLAEGDLEDTNGNGQLDRSEMDVRRSRTTVFQPQFGVTIRLGESG